MVPMKALDDLIDALSRVKAHGGALCGNNECWITGQDAAVEYQELDRAVEASQSSLTRLKETRNTLSALLRDVEHKLEAFRSKVLPVIQHHGFAHLPDEILGSIFELCDDGELDPAELRLRLARSGNYWLTVELIVHNHSDFVKHRGKFFELVLEHKERWRVFKFFIWDVMTSKQRIEVWVNLMLMTLDLELPSLTTLTINDDQSASAAGHRTRDGNIPEFHLTWKLPSLSSVHLGYHVPRPALWTELPSDLRWKPTLTSVHFRSLGIEEELDMLLRFLNTQPNLQDLSVTLEGFDNVSEEESNFEGNLFVANLPNLRSLSLTSYSSLMAWKVCRALVTPNVERLYLHFDLSPREDKNDTEHDLSMLLFELDSAPLKTLSLAVNTKRPYDTASEDILRYCDKWEHLALEGPYLWPPDDRVDSEKHVRLPRLRTLRLTDCPRMEALFVEELATAFASRSEIAEAGSVEIIRKSGLRRDLQQSFLRDKVVWHERPARTRF